MNELITKVFVEQPGYTRSINRITFKSANVLNMRSAVDWQTTLASDEQPVNGQTKWPINEP